MSQPTREKQELDNGLFVYTTQHLHPLRFVFEVELARFNTLVIEADFTGSKNLKVVSNGESELKLKSTLQPFTRSVLGEICMSDPKDRATLCVKFDYLLKPVEKERVKAVLHES
jgi:hypothetical protein